MSNTPDKEPEDKPTGPAGGTPGADPAAPVMPGTEQAAPPEVTAEQLQAQVADLTDRLLRAHAEMENIRKRAEREREETAKYAITRLAKDVVTVGDNFQRAIEAVPAGAAEQDPALKSFLEGVTMTERELLNVLERHGIKRVHPMHEPFNPHLHQAVMEIQKSEVPAGTIVQVFQAGFMIEDRVLRPAMVGVAKGGPKAGTAPGAANDGSGSPPNSPNP